MWCNDKVSIVEGGLRVTSLEDKIILGCISLFFHCSALFASDKAHWELTEKLYHAGVPWSSGLICCWTCWELGLYLASTLWKARAEQLSYVTSALWATREGFVVCSRMLFWRSALKYRWNVNFLFLFLRKSSKNVSDSASGWTWRSQSPKLFYTVPFHLQLSLIRDCPVLNPLKVCENMLVGGHLRRLPCKPVQSTHSSIVIPPRSIPFQRRKRKNVNQP